MWNDMGKISKQFLCKYVGDNKSRAGHDISCKFASLSSEHLYKYKINEITPTNNPVIDLSYPRKMIYNNKGF